MENDTWYESCMNACLSIYARMQSILDERQRRVLAGCICLELGHGSVVRFHNETGMAVSTIQIGKNEAKALPVGEDHVRTSATPYRTRRPGAGRKKKENASSDQMESRMEAQKGNVEEKRIEVSQDQSDDSTCCKAPEDAESEQSC